MNPACVAIQGWETPLGYIVKPPQPIEPESASGRGHAQSRLPGICIPCRHPMPWLESTKRIPRQVPPCSRRCYAPCPPAHEPPRGPHSRPVSGCHRPPCPPSAASAPPARLHCLRQLAVQPSWVWAKTLMPPTVPAARRCTLIWRASLIHHLKSGLSIRVACCGARTLRSRQRASRRRVFCPSPQTGASPAGEYRCAGARRQRGGSGGCPGPVRDIVSAMGCGHDVSCLVRIMHGHYLLHNPPFDDRPQPYSEDTK